MESQSQTIAKEMVEDNSEQLTEHRDLCKQASSAAREKELDIMYPDLATGKHAWSPNSGKLPPYLLNQCSREEETDESDDLEWLDDTESDSEVSSSSAKGTRKRVLSISESSSRKAREREKKKRRVSLANKLVSTLEKVTEWLIKETNARRQVNDRYSIEKCLQILNEIPGVVVGDPLYQFSSGFLEARLVCREMFILLPSDEARLAWLKYEQSLLEPKG